jgi:D-alanine transaminase
VTTSCPTGITPTVFVMTNAMKPPSAEQRSQGVACVTADDFRWEKAHIKSTSLLGAVFARQISFDAGAIETVMFRDGFLSEAAACNVWIVKDGSRHRHAQGQPGAGRHSLRPDRRICRAQGIPFELRRISRAEVLGADEVLLTSATKEVLAVTRLDGQPVGTGQPGPVYARLLRGLPAGQGRRLSGDAGDQSAGLSLIALRLSRSSLLIGRFRFWFLGGMGDMNHLV